MNKETSKQMITFLQFEQHGNIFTKHFAEFETNLSVDFDKEVLIYPEDKDLKINKRQIYNFSAWQG